jgi:hypothetical protein
MTIMKYDVYDNDLTTLHDIGLSFMEGTESF